MARELITSWGDYQAAIDRLLVMPCQKILIYDENMSQIRLDSSPRLAEIKRFLAASRNNSLKIALRDAEPLQRQHPLLINLLTLQSHQVAAQQTPAQIAHLRDSMLLIDDRHGLIRFEQNLPRAKLLIDEPDELRSYVTRFTEIWSEGGEPAGQTTLGL
jgi:hypothetical protein